MDGVMHFEYPIEGGDFFNAGTASSQVKKILKKLNVDSHIIKRVAVALYEAEVNIVAHAYSGRIPDIELAMKVGYSTASPKVREMGFGAGMGLPNIKKNADLLNITSEPGKGTRVEITTFLN